MIDALHLNVARRRILLALAALPCAPRSRAAEPVVDVISSTRALVFPRDFGAHPGARTEWWYATGWLGSEAAPRAIVRISSPGS